MPASPAPSPRYRQCGQDQQDAVSAHRAALVDLPRVEDEVLAQHRQIHRGARRQRCSGAPWKCGPSVSTERHAAPPSRYARASAGGSNSGRISPPDGDAFLISAISPNCPWRTSFSAEPKPRGASSRRAISGAARRGCVFVLRTRHRGPRVGADAGENWRPHGVLASSGHGLLQCGRLAPQCVQRGKCRAGRYRARRQCHALPQITRAGRDDQCGGGVQQHRVAIWHRSRPAATPATSRRSVPRRRPGSPQWARAAGRHPPALR